MAPLFGVEQPCTRACPRHPIHGPDHGCGGRMPEEVPDAESDISRFRNDFARFGIILRATDAITLRFAWEIGCRERDIDDLAK